eukprot:9261335-Pyramimonas_sp.AAC.1
MAQWRPVAKEVYEIYKKDKGITKGSPTGGLTRMISMIESQICSRLDIYVGESGESSGRVGNRTQGEKRGRGTTGVASTLAVIGTGGSVK